MDELYYGRGNDAENAALIQFLNEVFFDDDPTNNEFLGLLPKIYKDKYRPAYNNFVVREKDGTFRSAVGNFYADYLVGGMDIKACCIGNVAVGMNFRKMGYMKELMKISCDDMHANGTDIAYLGGHRQRYGYFGFEQAGISYDLDMSRRAYAHTMGDFVSGLTTRKLTENDTEVYKVIDEIYTKNPVAAKRPFDAYYDILCSWHQVPYGVFDGEKPVGYLVFNGETKNCSELGILDSYGIDRLVAAAFETAAKNGNDMCINFTSAPSDIRLLDFLTAHNDGFGVNDCEMILVFNFARVIKAYLKAKATYAKLCDGQATVLIHGKYGDENITVTVKDNNVTVEKTEKTPDAELSHFAATRAFFSLYQNERFNLPGCMQAWLPLPMFQSPCDTM